MLTAHRWVPLILARVITTAASLIVIWIGIFASSAPLVVLRSIIMVMVLLLLLAVPILILFAIRLSSLIVIVVALIALLLTLLKL